MAYVRQDQSLKLHWGALWAGLAIGWAAYFVLSLLGAWVGFASFSAYTANPLSGVGTGFSVYSACLIVVCSFVGAAAITLIAGDQRRDNAVMNSLVGWGFSWVIGMALIAMLAGGLLGAASNATALTTSLRNGVNPTLAARAQAQDASSGSAVAAAVTFFAGLLSCGAAILAGTVLARRIRGLSLEDWNGRRHAIGVGAQQPYMPPVERRDVREPPNAF